MSDMDSSLSGRVPLGGDELQETIERLRQLYGQLPHPPPTPLAQLVEEIRQIAVNLPSDQPIPMFLMLNPPIFIDLTTEIESPATD